MGRLIGAYRAAFEGLPREVWTLAAAMLVNRSGTMVLPFLSLYMTRMLGFTAEEAGRVLALYGFGALAGSLLGGWLSDRIGAVRVQVASLAASGIGFLAIGQAHGRAALALVVLATSVMAETFRPAVFTAVAAYSPPEVRVRSIALLRLAVNLGMSIGPAAGGLLAARHYGWLFVADAGTCWTAALILWLALVRRERVQWRSDGASPGPSPWRDAPFVAFLWLMLLLAIVFFQLMSTLPLYWRQVYGLSEATIGSLLASNALVIVLFEMVLIRAIDRFQPLRVVALGSLLVCTGFALLPLGRSVAFGLFATMVWTLGEMLSLPLSNGVVALRAHPASRGRYMGAYTLAFSAAFVIAPVGGTTVYERLGPDALWAMAGALGVALAVGFTLLAPRMRQVRT
jgi:predicted MFS family arabinose efflux permease